MRSRAALAIVVIVTVVTLSPQRASADATSAAGLARLAQRAKTDAGALTRLRRIDSVDGRPVDLDRALAGATSSELEARLDAIADGARSAPAPSSLGDARKDAADILSERRFQPTELPRPFAGPLRRLGAAVDRLIERIADVLPGGRATLWVIISALIVGLAVLIATRLARRKRASVAGTAVTADGKERKPEQPRDLLKEADRAEADGDWKTAVRLRFRAGLLRLGSRGAIAFRPSITTNEVRRRVRTRSFDTVARSFEEIAYGGRPATTEDLELSRSGWDDVLTRLSDVTKGAAA